MNFEPEQTPWFLCRLANIRTSFFVRGRRQGRQPLISEKRYKGVPPTIVVEVLNKHHMIITFFSHSRSWHGLTLESFFGKEVGKKEMV